MRKIIPIQLFYFLGILIILFFGFKVQFTKGSELKSESINFIVSQENVDAPRGLILDSEGRVLAQNELVYDVYIRYDKNLLESYNKLKSLKIESLFLKDIDTSLRRDQKVIANVSSDLVKTLKETNLNNLEFYPKYIRNYLYPEEFSHVIGYTGPVDQNDINNGSKPNSLKGKYRVEKLYEDELKGIPGELIKEGLSQIKINSKPGSNIHLTIDAKWQNSLYALMKDYSKKYNAAGGAGVVMNAKTGELKALVSFPGFNTNQIVRGISKEDFDSLESSRDKPLLDKATGSAFTPGSIFKVITSYSLLNNKVIDSFSTFFSNQCINLGIGYNFCEFNKNFYGQLDLKKALEKSSNLFFCNYALELDNKKGILQFIEAAKSFGIGKPTEIEFENENIGNMDSPEYKASLSGEKWFDGDTCNIAIGQGSILVSPIQMAVALSILNNDGKKVKPYFIDYIESQGNFKYFKPEIVDTVLDFDENYVEEINTGLSGVAYNYESPVFGFLKDLNYNVKAKTGSAETVEFIDGKQFDRVHSWIIGTFDYNGEMFTFSFFQRYGGGGYYITPLLRDFLNNI